MTKKRKIEILKKFKGLFKIVSLSGLCGYRRYMFLFYTLEANEKKWLSDLIRNNRPKKTYTAMFYFKPYVKAPRIKWINARIKELQ